MKIVTLVPILLLSAHFTIDTKTTTKTELFTAVAVYCSNDFHRRHIFSSQILNYWKTFDC